MEESVLSNNPPSPSEAGAGVGLKADDDDEPDAIYGPASFQGHPLVAIELPDGDISLGCDILIAHQDPKPSELDQQQHSETTVVLSPQFTVLSRIARDIEALTTSSTMLRFICAFDFLFSILSISSGLWYHAIGTVFAVVGYAATKRLNPRQMLLYTVWKVALCLTTGVILGVLWPDLTFNAIFFISLILGVNLFMLQAGLRFYLSIRGIYQMVAVAAAARSTTGPTTIRVGAVAPAPLPAPSTSSVAVVNPSPSSSNPSNLVRRPSLAETIASAQSRRRTLPTVVPVYIPPVVQETRIDIR